VGARCTIALEIVWTIVRGITHNLPSIYHVIRLVAAKKRTHAPHWRRNPWSEKEKTAAHQSTISTITTTYPECDRRGITGLHRRKNK
jgi:hypothetical protein